MDPIQIEAQLRTTFLALLGGDMTVYEGMKQQYIMRFNNESRNIATGMIAQANQRNSPITQADYQSVSMDLLNRYKASMPPTQQYAAPVMQQPVYAQQYAAPVMQQPLMAQPMYPMQQPIQYRPITPFNNLRYTQPQQYAPVIQQPVYQPMQPTMTQPIQSNNGLYSGALPSNVAQQHPPMAAPVAQQPPMASVPKADVPPMTAQEAAPLIQPAVPTYAIPTIVGRHSFADKAPQAIRGDVITYQQNDGKKINVVTAVTTSMLADVDTTIKALAKKKNAVDVTLKYVPYQLVSGNLDEMQKSFLEVKKLIADGRKENKAVGDIITSIVEYCDTKTKGIAKRIEGVIIDAYNSYVKVANNAPEGNAIIPDTEALECLQLPSTASAEKYIGMALNEFEQYSVYDPASIQVSGWLKEIDLGGDWTYTELKKNKADFEKWAKSHCIIKRPAEIYRYTTVDHNTTDVAQGFGYVSSTPPDDALEYFTMEAIAREPVRVVTMIVKDGKSFITCVGSLDRSGDAVHVEFE